MVRLVCRVWSWSVRRVEPGGRAVSEGKNAIRVDFRAAVDCYTIYISSKFGDVVAYL
jgi:hypothetical protein